MILFYNLFVLVYDIWECLGVSVCVCVGEHWNIKNKKKIFFKFSDSVKTCQLLKNLCDGKYKQKKKKIKNSVAKYEHKIVKQINKRKKKTH